MLPTVVCQDQVRRNQARPRRAASRLAVAEGAALHKERRPTLCRDFVGHCPQPQKCPCGCGTLRRRHILIALLLNAFLPARLRLAG